MLNKLRAAILRRRIAAGVAHKHAIACDAAERIHAQQQHLDKLFARLYHADPLPVSSAMIARRIELREKGLA